MSFSGDLQHLPIVDVIQLLHSTGKTGTLYIKNQKGESQLTFKDGYFVSANHVHNSVRIGRLLVEMKAISQEELEQTLLEQKNAEANRKPLVAMLIEAGKINKDDAYKGLETLIEMTIVEILTWTSGTFTLDVDRVNVSDEYRYFPETLKQDLSMNTQSLLMDALRIYDEKKRDGTLSAEPFAGDENQSDAAEPADGITADLLGLDDLDALEKKIPDVFSGLKDNAPEDVHRQKIGSHLKGASTAEQDKLYAYLNGLSAGTTTDPAPTPAPAVIAFSPDEVIKHLISAVCMHEGLFVFTTDEEVNLDHIIDQTLAKGLMPVLVIDTPTGIGATASLAAAITLLRAKRAKYPQLSILHLVPPQDQESFRQILQSGARAVLPRAALSEGTGSFADDMITSIETFRSYLKTSFTGPAPQFLHQFRESLLEIEGLKETPDVVFAVLRFVSQLFERAITFIVGKSELIAERGIGVQADKSTGPTPALLYRVPLGQPSLFQNVVTGGSLYFGHGNDPLMAQHLHGMIGTPATPTVLLLPIKSFGRVCALIYADYGTNNATQLPVELLEAIAGHANLVLDNAFYRKKFEKPAQPQ